MIGCSAGYASPEHYGLDFSSDSDTVNGESETEAESKSGQDSETEVDNPTVERTITESDTESTEKEEGNRKEKSFFCIPEEDHRSGCEIPIFIVPEQPYITFSVVQSRQKMRRQSYRFQKKNIVRRL